MKKVYNFLLILSVVLVYLVIAAGATVRMTGSGMAALIGLNALVTLFPNRSFTTRSKKNIITKKEKLLLSMNRFMLL